MGKAAPFASIAFLKNLFKIKMFVFVRGLEIINFTFIREIFESGASDFENRNASIA
jgi:hypothetical protein